MNTKCCALCEVYSPITMLHDCDIPSCQCHRQPEPTVDGAGVRETIKKQIYKKLKESQEHTSLIDVFYEEVEKIFEARLSRLHSHILEGLRKDILSYAHKECEQGKCEPCEICLSSLLSDSGLYKAEKLINQAFKDL